jgi:tetratricopeptide (TPR) repeat protein
LQSKQYAQAVAAFTAALQKNDSLKQAYLLRGDCEQQLKKYGDAASDYGQYSLLSPNDVGGYLRLSKAYGCLGKNNLALSYLSKAVVLDPRDASIYTARAALYDKLGKHAMAVDDRNVAVALAKARTHPNKGVVMTVAPGPKKAGNVSAPKQQQSVAGDQQANGGGQPASNGSQPASGGGAATSSPSQVAGSASSAKSHTP